MGKKIERNASRLKRQLRMRKRLRGVTERPRVSVFKSTNNISLQLIDDTVGQTLCTASTLMQDFKDKNLPSSKNLKAAEELGQLFADKLKASNVSAVVFDRSGYKYHGKVKAIAETLRKAGIQL